MPNASAVLSVKFKSSLPIETVLERAQEYLPQFREVPGLVQKYYLTEPETGAVSGFYLFATAEDRDAYWNSELAAGIPERYGVISESLRIEQYDLNFALHE